MSANSSRRSIKSEKELRKQEIIESQSTQKKKRTTSLVNVHGGNTSKDNLSESGRRSINRLSRPKSTLVP